jgi:uncharacterized surface protein with fasciclin (FAS1) repeats
MRSAVLAMAAAVIGISITAAACGSEGNSASTAAPHHRGPARARQAESSPPAMNRAAAISRRLAAHRTFGPACRKLPAAGLGSRRAMASVPAATAVSQTPLLTDLAHALDAAGLIGTLNSAPAITLFAPDNSAFRMLGSGNVRTLMANRADLVKVLKYYVVRGRVTPAELAERKPLRTLAGIEVHPVKSRNVYTVNGVRVICGNLSTANATIYIIGQVLVPTT